MNRNGVWAAVALTVIALLAYANSFHTGFALDNSLLLRDARLRTATAGNIALILQHTLWWPIAEIGVYRPLTSLSFLLNYAVLGNGEHPEGYHIVNFILHAGNIWLAFALALRLLRRFWPAVFIAGCWAVHPILTESVTNMIGRADLIAGMSVLGGFLIYLRSTESRGWRKVLWLAALALTTTLGMFAKENAVAIVGAIALYEHTWWRHRSNVPDAFWGTIAVLPPIAAFLYQRSAVFSSSLPAHVPFVDNPIADSGFWAGRLTALKVMAHYLALLVWPSRLSSDYSWSQIPLVTGSAGDWLGWLVVCAAGAALILLYRRQPAMYFFGLFAFATFLPVSNLLFPIGTIMGDRLLYLPAYGLIACLVLAVYWITEQFGMSRAAPMLLLLLGCGFAIRTWARNQDWQSNLTLGESAVRAAPQSYKARELLADALYNSDPQHSQLDRAIEQGEQAVALLDPLPDSQNTWSSYRQLATFYLAKGGVPASQRAVELLRRVIAIHKAYPPPPPPKPGDIVVQVQFSEAWRTLSGVLLRVGDTRSAYDAAIQARDLNPGIPEVWRVIGNALHAAGRDDEAITAFMEGELLTSDSSLAVEAVIVYRERPDANCTIMQGTYGPVANSACPIVHKQICTAVSGAMQLLVERNRKEDARVMMRRVSEGYGCAIEPLRKILGQ